MNRAAAVATRFGSRRVEAGVGVHLPPGFWLFSS
jgi:hypothetical protein